MNLLRQIFLLIFTESSKSICQKRNEKLYIINDVLFLFIKIYKNVPDSETDVYMHFFSF